MKKQIRCPECHSYNTKPYSRRRFFIASLIYLIATGCMFSLLYFDSPIWFIRWYLSLEIALDIFPTIIGILMIAFGLSSIMEFISALFIDKRVLYKCKNCEYKF